MTEEEVIGGDVRDPAPCLSLSSGRDDVVSSLLSHHHVNAATLWMEAVTWPCHLRAHRSCLLTYEESSVMRWAGF